MTQDAKKITEQSVVELHFKIRLEDGSVAEDTRNYKKPARLKIGDGSLSPGFESLLLGLGINEKKNFKLNAESAFGLPLAENIHILPRRQFSSDIELEEGLIVGFADPKGGEVPGIIRSFDADQVTVDFNHPLAGHGVIFDVEILAIDPD